ncbi:hypothetical protein BD560DRAFT_393027 [Blakeslea trispora]|nr:hypothetical protein BD560DRAFT_393027 [Blakeslea trispora]
MSVCLVQIFAHALKTTFETMNVDLGLKGDQACLRYQDQLFDVGEMSFELIKETDDEDDEEVVDNEEDQVEEEDLEVEEEVVVPRPKRARKEAERYEATIRAPTQQKKEVAVAKKKNRGVVVANHIIAIREMPVVAQPSQEVGLPEQLTTNEMVEMFKLCEQAELNIKRRRYELALRM